MKKTALLGLMLLPALKSTAFAQANGIILPPPPAAAKTAAPAFSVAVTLPQIPASNQGVLYKLILEKPRRLETIQITTNPGALNIRQLRVTLKSGSSVRVGDFANLPILNASDAFISDNLAHLGTVKDIEILVNSADQDNLTDAKIQTSSNDGPVKLFLKKNSESPVTKACGGNDGQAFAVRLQAASDDIQKWITRRDQYNSYSTEYAFAQKQAMAAGNTLKTLAASEDSSGISYIVLEKLAVAYKELAEKFNSYSEEHASYSATSDRLFVAMQTAIDHTILCGISSKQLLAMADQFDTNRDKYNSYTMAYAFENKAAEKVFNAAIQIFPAENVGADYRLYDQYMNDFIAKRDTFNSYTTAYSSYDKLARLAATLSENYLRSVVGQLSADQSFAFMEYFKGQRDKYNSYSVGYEHFSTMESIVSNGH